MSVVVWLVLDGVWFSFVGQAVRKLSVRERLGERPWSCIRDQEVGSSNLPAPIFSSQLGHASFEATFDCYGHLLTETRRQIGQRLDAQLFGAGELQRVVN